MNPDARGEYNVYRSSLSSPESLEQGEVATGGIYRRGGCRKRSSSDEVLHGFVVRNINAAEAKVQSEDIRVQEVTEESVCWR